LLYMGAGYTTSGRSEEECFHLPCSGNNYIKLPFVLYFVGYYVCKCSLMFF
jgi:hypothetical protein